MDKNITPPCNYEEALSLGMETLEYCHKIYGEFSLSVSDHMWKICMILSQIKDIDQDYKRNFLKKTKDRVKITHGCDHEIYHLLERIGTKYF